MLYGYNYTINISVIAYKLTQTSFRQYLDNKISETIMYIVMNCISNNNNI